MVQKLRPPWSLARAAPEIERRREYVDHPPASPPTPTTSAREAAARAPREPSNAYDLCPGAEGGCTRSARALQHLRSLPGWMGGPAAGGGKGASPSHVTKRASPSHVNF